MRFMKIILMLLMASFLPQVAWSKPPQINDDIAAIFETAAQENYSKQALDAAAAKLRKIDHPSAIAASIIAMQKGSGDSKQIKAQFEKLEMQANAYIAALRKKYPTSKWYRESVDVSDYDGSARSMIDNLIEVRALGSVLGGANKGWQIVSQFTVPCGLFIKYPELGGLSRIQNSGHRYNFPAYNVGCGIVSYQRRIEYAPFMERFANLKKYWKQVHYGTQWSDVCGSMRIDIRNGISERQTAGLFYPEIYLRELERRNEQLETEKRPPLQPIIDLRDSAFMDWALVGRANYRAFLQLEELHQKALVEVIKYYQEIFHYDLKTSRVLAANLIFTETRAGGYIPEDKSDIRSFSRALKSSLDGQRDIRLAILEGDHIKKKMIPDPKLELAYQDRIRENDYSVPMSGAPEPLMHLATRDIKVMKKLLDAGYGINSRGALGKTPLMVAAQDDKLESVKWLIEHGADINAASLLPFDIPNNANSRTGYGSCAAYRITTGHRTALMYGISEGTKPTVLALLAAGADVQARDSIGRNSVDYLKKRGPYRVQKLSDQNRKSLLKKVDYDSFRIPYR